MKSDNQKLYELLLDGKPHRTDEILRVVYGSSHLGIARISARAFDIRKICHATIPDAWADEEVETLSWYQMTDKGNPPKRWGIGSSLEDNKVFSKSMKVETKPLTVFNTQLYSPGYIRMKEEQKQAKLI